MSTKYYQVEPPGYGYGVYGHPSDDAIEGEFSRGYGEPTTKYTVESEVTTDYSQVEPMGFGLSPFGDPDVVIEREYGKGFGDPLTDYTEDNSG